MKLHSIINPFHGLSYFQEQTASTMLDAQAQPSHGALFLTNQQLAGQGRFSNRTWHSQQQDLTFTLCLSVQQMILHAPLPLLVALALQQTIKQQLPTQPVNIKWPNDILVNDHKVSGILIQLFNDFYLIGVGINLSNKSSLNLVNSNSYPAAGLVEFQSAELLSSKETLLNNLLAALSYQLSNINWLKQYNQCLFKPSNPLTYQVGEKLYHGTIERVSEDGSLVMRVNTPPHEKVHLYAGEVVRR